MFNKLGLQVYTVRDHIKDEQSMDATFAKLAEIGYSELQTAGWESETYAALAKKHGLTVVGTHYNYGKIINNIDETVALHKALGTTNIGVGGCSARSYDEIMAFIEKYNAAAAEYAKGKRVGGEVIDVVNKNGVNYTVPQRIRPENVDKGVEIFFRTNAVRGSSVIRVTSNGQKIAEFKREHMAPGEMEKINIPKVLLNKCEGTIEVEVLDA